MENHETRQGILALIDIVNYTGQSTKLAEKYTAQYSQYFQEKINSIVNKHKFRAIKFLGDAALIFGREPAELLEIMLDLFERDKPEDKYGFISRFRLVAHFGFFQFQMKNRQPVDLVSPEGIKVFRMEKYAGAGELLVTHELYRGLKSLLTSRNIEARRMTLEQSLKGFDGEEWFPPFYKLKIARKELGAANFLEQRMDELEREVQFITVFGNMYSPVPMDKNFINLSIHCDWDKEPDFDCEEFLEDDDEPVKGTKSIRGKRKKIREEDDWIFIEKMERRHRPDFKEIDVNTLYENKGNKYTNGVIFGLPGAGKTTILRHLAFKELKANKSRERREKGREKIIMFVPCRGIPFYDAWHKDQYGPGRVEPDENTALAYMTWVFLFGGKAGDVVSPEERVEFRHAVNKVKQAFKENRLTLLVDALDEAPDSPSKERIKELVLLLASQNRVFLTSRPSERIHLRQENLPVFNVLSLTMDQVREVARHLMDPDSFIYKKFDEAIWREEIVVKMAATPITALLVTAYFQVYGQFDHRYPMYDLLMKFVLVKVWENIKTDAFPYKNLELFFKEVKKKGFFEKYADAGAMYDGLGFLCYRLFFEGADGKVQRMVNETTLKAHFTGVISGAFNYDEDKVMAFVDQWVQRFQEDHLLLQAGAGEYVFIHSTIMEYLAAFHLVRQAKKDKENLPGLVRAALKKQEFLGLETIPIAAGNDLLKGFAILSVLRDIKVDYDRDLLDELGIKCLAEVEWQITKTFQGLRIEGLRKNILDIIRQHRTSFAWVYEGLQELVLTPDKTSMEENIQRFVAFTRLSRDTLMEEYLDYKSFNKGDSQLVNLRKELLDKLVRKEPLEKWYNTHKEKVTAKVEEIAAAEEENVLRLDSPGYHPEDKNFKYYRDITGKELAGFLGSPNMRHNNWVRSCAFSPDGKRFVSASYDGTLKLWDAESGKEIRTLAGHQGEVSSCAFSPRGSEILSASSDNTLKLWDAKSGKCTKTLPLPWIPYYVCFSTQNPTLAVIANLNGTLTLFDFKVSEVSED